MFMDSIYIMCMLTDQEAPTGRPPDHDDEGDEEEHGDPFEDGEKFLAVEEVTQDHNQDPHCHKDVSTDNISRYR